MSRLIFIPQCPVKLRYQEWWYTEFIKNLKPYFSEILTLGDTQTYSSPTKGEFSVHTAAIHYETLQIQQYLQLTLQEDDCLLLNDLSYPGLFANVLFHKRPKRCVAICHATSKNRYDYFAKDRKTKFPIETATAKLFDKIIVGSKYHAQKLGWDNTKIILLPDPPFLGYIGGVKNKDIVSVARPGLQKVNKKLEKLVEKRFGTIKRPEANTWDEYYQFLADSKILLITSKEETYGYQVIDGIINGCVVLAPRACSYPELLPDKYLYNDWYELMSMINDVTNDLLRPLPLDYHEKHKLNFYKILANALKNDA